MKSVVETAAQALLLAILAVPPLRAADVPAGAELHIRLTGRISSADSRPGAAVSAVLIAPVLEDGNFILPPGAEITGTVKSVQSAADPQKAPALELDFNTIAFEGERDTLQARVASVDNSKESVDDKGVITGTPASKTYTSEINRGITKMSNSDRLSGLAGILQAAKKILVTDTDPDITYDAGVEMTLKTIAPVHVTRASAGIAAQVRPISNVRALANLVAHMPLRADATNGRPSDFTNILFVATEQQLAGAFEAAGWSTADKLNGLSKFSTAMAMIEQRGYKEAPVSILLVNGRAPDLVYQKQNDTFDSRHHLRIWRLPQSFEGRPVWVCTATHDIGISFSEREGTFIHRIDSNIDNERAKVVNDLVFAQKVDSLALAPRENVPTDAQNATGDELHTDGRVAVLVLR